MPSGKNGARMDFAAARATSTTRLRLAHRSTPTAAQITARSPGDTVTHQVARSARPSPA